MNKSAFSQSHHEQAVKKELLNWYFSKNFDLYIQKVMPSIGQGDQEWGLFEPAGQSKPC